MRMLSSDATLWPSGFRKSQKSVFFRPQRRGRKAVESGLKISGVFTKNHSFVFLISGIHFRKFWEPRRKFKNIVKVLQFEVPMLQPLLCHVTGASHTLNKNGVNQGGSTLSIRYQHLVYYSRVSLSSAPRCRHANNLHRFSVSSWVCFFTLYRTEITLLE